MKKIYLLLLFIISLNISATEKSDNIIIFKVISDSGVITENIEMLNTAIETNLTDMGYGIINEKIQNEAMEEQKKQQNSDCYDDTCLVDTGRMLAARKLLVIRISQKGDNNFFVKIRKIDIESGIIENTFAYSKSLDFTDYDNLNLSVKHILGKLVSKEKHVGQTDKSMVKKIKNNRLEKNINNVKKSKKDIKKYLLKINTDIDYDISYVPIIESKNLGSHIPDYTDRKYFEKGSKLIYLPEGKYQITLSKTGYKNVYRDVLLNKDTIISISSEREAFTILGLETVFEYKKFNITNENHFHSGIIVDLLSYRNKDIKLDFFRVGFLTDFKSYESLKEIKFSMFNVELKTEKNFMFSFTLGYLLGDGSFLFTNDKEKDDLYLTPLGMKVGYFRNLTNDFIFKIYGKLDWLMYIPEGETPQNGVCLTFGTSFELFF